MTDQLPGGISRAQAGTLVRVAVAVLACVGVLAGYLLWLEGATLGNDVEGDHITAAVGAFMVAQPWAAFGLAILFVGGIAFAVGLLTGHIGEAAKSEGKAFHDFGSDYTRLDPRAGYTATPVARFCDHCGTLADPKRSNKCANCGAPLEVDR